MVEAASILNCKVRKVPFLYLGLSIGGNPCQLAFWESVLCTIKSRLSGWKSRFISFEARLTLLKSVLTSLDVYALSFFKAPSGIISFIESLLNFFFWVGVRIAEKYLGLIGILFVLERSMVGWGLGN